MPDSADHDTPDGVAGRRGIEAAEALLVKGVGASNVGRTAEATKLLEQALHALPVGSGDPEAVAIRIRILSALSYTVAETSTVADGLVHLGTASDLVGALPDGPRRLTLRGRILHQQGVMLLRIGRAAETVAAYDEAIPLLERAVDDPAGDPELLTKAFLNRGDAYIKLNKPLQAELDMLNCISLAVRYGFDRVAAKARGNLGEIAQLTGDVPNALQYFEGVEREFRRIAPGLVPRTQIDQARALLAAGLAEEAARHLDEALPVLREHRISQDLAEAEVARAAAALLQGDFELSQQFAGSAQRRFKKRGSEPWAEVAALTKLRAEINAALADQPSNATPGKAAAHAERLTSMGLVDEAATARLLGARLALRGNAIEVAESLLAQVPSLRKFAPIDHKMLLRLCRAELAVARGQNRKAFAQAKAGFAELGAVRDRMGGLDLVCGTAVHGIELGRLAVNLVLDKARTDADARRLLAWQERTRAQVYRYEPLPPIDNQELANRVAELRTVLRSVQQARLVRQSTAQLERRADALQREVSRLGYSTSLWGRPRPVSSPEEVAERLGDRALISFVGPGSDLAAVVISGGRTRLVRLGRKEELLETAQQLHADLDALAPDDLIAPLVAAVTRSAQHRIDTLDHLLFGPNGIPAELLRDRELVVVPVNELYSVPWESLPTLRGRAVSVAPSATAWVSAAEPRPADKAADGRVVLVRGPDLPESESEMDQLHAVYPGAIVLDRENATTAAVLSAMDGAKLVHIAAHGTHEPANALFSRLELADGGLLAHEVAQLQRPPEHIVLASCELALAHIRPGDEPLGFAGAMLASGARTVVAAVTRVGHRSAALAMTDYHRRLANRPVIDIAETMTDYHRRLASGTRPARALAEATAADPLRRPFICLGAG